MPLLKTFVIVVLSSQVSTKVPGPPSFRPRSQSSFGFSSALPMEAFLDVFISSVI